jgi:hypothetical protein
MINNLTPKQSAKFTEVRERMFHAATSTITDRERAERAVRVIAAPALDQYDIHWCSTLDCAQELQLSLKDSLRNSLRYSLWYSLWHSLHDSLRYSLRSSLQDSLRSSLQDSFWSSLPDALRYSLRVSLQDSVWDSFWDSVWIAYYVALFEMGLMSNIPEIQARLDAFAEFAESAFAIWASPGHVILLEKPKHVTCLGGKLTYLSWI